MKVLGDKILVEVASNETVTTGGIIIPDSAGQERKYEGRVVDVGNNPDIETYGVKKAVIPLSFRHLKTNGYGFFFSIKKTIKGFTTKAKNNIQPTKTSKSFP